MDISHALQHCRLQVKPDILFLPSELRPFTKVYIQELCVFYILFFAGGSTGIVRQPWPDYQG